MLSKEVERNQIILAGGGHAHLLILRKWLMNPIDKPKGLITLVSRDSVFIYSGMFPGWLAGKYKYNDIIVDLRRLANLAGVCFIQSNIIGIDHTEKKLILENRPELKFDIISLNIGSETHFPKDLLVDFCPSQLIPIKPFDKFFEWTKNQDLFKSSSNCQQITVLGAGLAGLEVISALRDRWPIRNLNLICKEGQLSSSIRNSLSNSRIRVSTRLKDSDQLIVLCTGSRVPDWLQQTYLPKDQTGRILTYQTLQVINHPSYFAVGDCAVVEGFQRPPSGVWSVRASKKLGENILKIDQKKALSFWTPQSFALQLAGLGSSHGRSIAIASWGDFTFGPNSFFWQLKKYIDLNFIKKFSFKSSLMIERSKDILDCRGCAAKISSQSLFKALSIVNSKGVDNKQEDAFFIDPNYNKKSVYVQSVDGFPALISDPWLNGRITTFHACTDIFASGASLVSAQAVITLPYISSNIQEEYLRQTLLGIKSSLNEQGADLIGGHTIESRAFPPSPSSIGIQISLSINGKIKSGDTFWSKGGMKAGDSLMLSGGLGVGILFAGLMQGEADPIEIDKVLECMTNSARLVSSSLEKIKQVNKSNKLVHACTDITGFGLIGHLNEMIIATNNVLGMGERPIRVELHSKSIPFLEGVKSLIGKDIRSTMASSNSYNLNLLNKTDISLPRVTLSPNSSFEDKQNLKVIREILIDPQTCGPLLISSDPILDPIFKDLDNWIKIGTVLNT
tara:strand:+ start:9908 stop:12109 length:2202 start_codon:yes stop_codon:yes gene_type:complete